MLSRSSVDMQTFKHLVWVTLDISFQTKTSMACLGYDKLSVRLLSIWQLIECVVKEQTTCRSVLAWNISYALLLIHIHLTRTLPIFFNWIYFNISVDYSCKHRTSSVKNQICIILFSKMLYTLMSKTMFHYHPWISFSRNLILTFISL